MANHLLNVSPIIPAVSELASTFGFKSLHTVRNYIDYLKQAYMLIGIKKYSAKSKMRITQEKLYAVDVALMNKRENALVECIQVSYDISNEKTRKREINGLLLANKQTKCKNLLLLTIAVR